MTTYEGISVVVHDTHHEITLTRPDVLNRVDELLHDELTAAFRHLAERPSDARAVVLASTGKVFSAGGDFDWILDGNKDVRVAQVMMRQSGALLDALLAVPMPVVGAMHGDAIGLGATLLLGCDSVVAHRGARLSDPHVAIGLVAGDGGCVFWPEHVGTMRAKRYLLTGDALPAQLAYELGLVTDLVEDADDVIGEARALAGRIAALPPLAVQGTKQVLNTALRLRVSELLDLSLSNEATTLGSADLVEAVGAFREKRQPPAFTGR
jgi:enoyl-CoA hydratase